MAHVRARDFVYILAAFVLVEFALKPFHGLRCASMEADANSHAPWTLICETTKQTPVLGAIALKLEEVAAEFEPVQQQAIADEGEGEDVDNIDALFEARPNVVVNGRRSSSMWPVPFTDHANHRCPSNRVPPCPCRVSYPLFVSLQHVAPFTPHVSTVLRAMSLALFYNSPARRPLGTHQLPVQQPRHGRRNLKQRLGATRHRRRNLKQWRQ